MCNKSHTVPFMLHGRSIHDLVKDIYCYDTNTNPFVLCYNYLLRAPGNFQAIRKQQIAANLQATNKQLAACNTCTMTLYPN